MCVCGGGGVIQGTVVTVAAVNSDNSQVVKKYIYYHDFYSGFQKTILFNKEKVMYLIHILVHLMNNFIRQCMNLPSVKECR